eukprot:5697074-Lingulodinium_polyedra.AAC.1
MEPGSSSCPRRERSGCFNVSKRAKRDWFILDRHSPNGLGIPTPAQGASDFSFGRGSTRSSCSEERAR